MAFPSQPDGDLPLQPARSSASLIPAVAATVLNLVKYAVYDEPEFLPYCRIFLVNGKLVSAGEYRHAQMFLDEFQIAVIRSAYAGKYICIRNDYRIFRFHKSSI